MEEASPQVDTPKPNPSGREPSTEPVGFKPDGKKIKIALIMSYNGTGYQGLQVNPGCKSIEEDIEDAIHKAGFIADLNHKAFAKIGWSRAARTDKGVHAAGNVVAVKLVIAEELVHPAIAKLKAEGKEVPENDNSIRAPDYDFCSKNLVEAINCHLPPQIRAIRAIRVGNSFDSKHSASSRTYEYIIPSFAFIPLEKYPAGVYDEMIKNVPTIASGASVDAMDQILASMEKEEKETADDDDDESGDRRQAKKQKTETVPSSPQVSEEVAEVDSTPKPNVVADVPSTFISYRMSDEERARVDSVLKIFCGTKNHHNFTKGRIPKDPSCKRYITSFVTTGFFYVDGVEFLHMVVHGQSFMLHQIRKMVGYTIARCRGSIKEELDEKVFTLNRIRVPIAPALGLLLDRVHFKIYDKKMESLNRIAVKQGAHQDVREYMDDAYTACREDIKAFKEKWIYPEICHKELKTQNCWNWLHWINDEDYWGQPQEDDKGTKYRGPTKVARPNLSSAEDFSQSASTGFEYVNVIPQGQTTVTLPSYAKPSEDIKHINEKPADRDMVI